MSPKLADEARVVKASRIMRDFAEYTLETLSSIEPSDDDEEIVREAARRELLRRSLFKEKVG